MAQPQLRIVDESGRRKPLRVAFTVKGLETLKPPATGRRFIYDTRCGGLAVQITPTGHRAFYYIRKLNGRPVRVKLGDVGQISIEQARKLTAKHSAAVAEGQDPSQTKRAMRGELTLAEIREQYHTEHALIRCSPRTIISEDSLWLTAVKSLHGRRVSTIGPSDVARLHGKLAAKRGQRTANRMVQYVGRLFRYARKHQLHIGDNPAESIDLFTETSRERFLSAEEMPRFIAAAEAEGQPFSDWFTLAVFTGARSLNLRMMRWACLDLGKRVWAIPAEEAKNKQPMVVHLAGPAVDILKRRQAEAMPGEVYVFPSRRRAGKLPYMTQPQRAFERICKRAGIKDIRIHDLRRSLGAWQAIGGASLPVIGASLGHRDHRATQVYARLSADPVAVSVDAAVAAMTTKPAKSVKRTKRTKRTK